MKIFKFILIVLFLFTLTNCDNSTPEVPKEERAKYTVTINSSENGTVTSDKSEALAGEFVIFTITPNEGYMLDNLLINDKTVDVENNKYTVFNVRENIDVKVTFKREKIRVRYFDETGNVVLFQKSSDLVPAELPYLGETPTKNIDTRYYYEFIGWYTDKVNGSKVENFTFNETTNLYARFASHEYTLNIDNDLELNVFEEKQINITSTLVEPEIEFSSDSNIIKVSQTGNVLALNSGNAKVTVKIEGMEFICDVVVKPADLTYKALKVYGIGYVNYTDSVATMNSMQATIVDSTNKPVEFKYVDYSADILIDSATTGNFGLQFNKTVNDSGSAISFFQFNFETGNTNNVKLYKDNTSTAVANTICSYKLEVGKIYNFRVVTAPAANNEIRVCCYINNELVIDVTTTAPSANGNQCGIRMAANVTNRLSNIKMNDNTPEYKVTTSQTTNGTVVADKNKLKHGESLMLTVSPNEGYYLSSLIINDKEMVSDVSNNVFNMTVLEDVVITAKFDLIPEEIHTVSLNYENYELYALESFVLTPSTNELNPTFTWSSTDSNVVTINDGKVFAVGSGTAIVTVTMGTSTASCVIAVKVAEGYSFKSVYGSGQADATTTNGVYTFGKNGVQSDLMYNDETADLKYFEIELNVMLGCDITSNHNFGFQVHKTKSSNGNISKAYMLKATTDINNNISITKNGTGVNSGGFALQAGNVYRVKLVVTQVAEGTKIEGYIDGQLVCSYVDSTPLSGTIFGIRCASLSDNNSPHKVAIVSVKKY